MKEGKRKYVGKTDILDGEAHVTPNESYSLIYYEVPVEDPDDDAVAPIIVKEPVEEVLNKIREAQIASHGSPAGSFFMANVVNFSEKLFAPFIFNTDRIIYVSIWHEIEEDEEEKPEKKSRKKKKNNIIKADFNKKQ